MGVVDVEEAKCIEPFKRRAGLGYIDKQLWAISTYYNVIYKQ